MKLQKRMVMPVIIFKESALDTYEYITTILPRPIQELRAPMDEVLGEIGGESATPNPRRRLSARRTPSPKPKKRVRKKGNNILGFGGFHKKISNEQSALFHQFTFNVTSLTLKLHMVMVFHPPLPTTAQYPVHLSSTVQKSILEKALTLKWKNPFWLPSRS